MNRTYRFNILDKRVITTEAALLQAMDDFLQAMKSKKAEENEWFQAALGLLRGIAIVFYHLRVIIKILHLTAYACVYSDGFS